MEEPRERLFQLQRELDYRSYVAARRRRVILLSTLPVFLLSILLPLVLDLNRLARFTSLLAAVSFLALAFFYLQSDPIGVSSGFQRYFQELLWRLEEEQRAIRETVKSQPKLEPDKLLEAAEKARLVQDLRAQIENQAQAELMEALKKRAFEESGEAELGERFEFTVRRLKDEIHALGQRGNLNLAIGILTTLAGIGVLGYTVYTTVLDVSSVTSMLAHYIPRLSLVLFVEVFAYCFLRHYK